MNPAAHNILAINGGSSSIKLAIFAADPSLYMKSKGRIERDAIAIFCYQTKKWIGAFATTLDGLDTLVFAGGIGDNIPNIRARICAVLKFLDIELDCRRNQHSEHVISADAARVRVRVMRTNVELVIASSVCRILELDVGEARIES